AATDAYLALRGPAATLSASPDSRTGDKPDLEVEAQRERRSLEGVQRRASFVRIEQSIDRRTARPHATRHLCGRDVLRLHLLLQSVRQELLPRERSNLIEFAELFEHLLEFVFRLLLHVPSFMRLRASAITPAGVF